MKVLAVAHTYIDQLSQVVPETGLCQSAVYVQTGATGGTADLQMLPLLE